MSIDAHWQVIRHISTLLAERRYEDLAQLCAGSRMSAEDIEEVVASYGRTLVQLPHEAAALVDSMRVTGASKPTWSVVVPMFTQEEGRSDLSLELTVTESKPGLVAVQLDDLRVL